MIYDFLVMYEGKYVTYTTAEGDRRALHIGDYDISTTPEEIEEDLPPALSDEPNRKALVNFMYFAVITNYLASYKDSIIDKFLRAAWNTEGIMRTIWMSKAFAMANKEE